MSTGAEAIAEERRRQIEVEGFTAEHDDQYLKGELARSANALLRWGRFPQWRAEPPGDWWLPAAFWKPRDRRANLVRAGAMIAAEIDRLDRLAAREERGDSAA
ncbi:hypothetical protein [Rhodobacteraceae bacterium DSL-40]|uniref:hypothetical protein n=1 Tax=Amaricoccus sp. B4 TaxID=3368557 RepID=UPI000DAE6A9A